MKINRLLQIIIILMNKETVTAKYLADKFEVSVRTIYRDINTLTLSGVPLYSSKGSKGGICLMEGYRLHGASFKVVNHEKKSTDALKNISREISLNKKLEEKNKSKENEVIGFENSISKEILMSWERCRSKNVPINSFDLNNIMRPEEKGKYVLDYLDEYKQEGFREFSYMVKNLNLDISIYDEKSRLKYIINFDPSYEYLYPKVGYFKDASEFLIGTNSTSLAIKENKPWMVVGNEHYKSLFHEYSCAAAPIYKNGQIAGTVNASFMHTSVSERTLNAVYSLARIYEDLIFNNATNQLYKKKSNSNIEGLILFENIWGHSKEIQNIKSIAKEAALTDTPIMICGEIETGKKRLAKAIHYEGFRKNGPFISIDCKAVSNELAELEFFGYRSKQGESSKKNKKGALEKAHRGTLYLENIDGLSYDMQIKLLKCFSENSVINLGKIRKMPIDIRIIVSSEYFLINEVQQNTFKKELYNRVAGIQIYIPPLRERKEDIKEIVLKYQAERYGNKKTALEKDIYSIIDDFEQEHWTENITELIRRLEDIAI